jgi:hypothetical protein
MLVQTDPIDLGSIHQLANGSCTPGDGYRAGSHSGLQLGLPGLALYTGSAYSMVFGRRWGGLASGFQTLDRSAASFRLARAVPLPIAISWRCATHNARGAVILPSACAARADKSFRRQYLAGRLCQLTAVKARVDPDHHMPR